MNNIIDRATCLLEGKKVYSSTTGYGVVKSCTLSNDSDILIEIEFENKTAKYQLRTAFKTRFLNFENVDFEALKSVIDDTEKVVSEAEQIRREEMHRRIMEEKEKEAEEKEAARMKKAEEQFEASKRRAVINFNIRCQDSETDSFVADSADYYFNLGWLAANVKTVSARLPDYLDNAFSAHFGIDTPRTTVDTSKRTSGGLKPQWTYAFTASITKDKDVPNSLRDSLNSSENKIADTDLIWTLIGGSMTPL